MQNKTQNEKNWAVALHLSMLSGALIPIASIIAPIAIWLCKRKESKFLDDQGKEAINFMINELVLALSILTITTFASFAGMMGPTNGSIAPAFGLILVVVGLLIGALGVGLPILAAIQCAKDEDFKYPYIYRIIK